MCLIALKAVNQHFLRYCVDLDRAIKEKLQRLLDYVVSYWMRIITPERFCVHRNLRRTNNNVENWHGKWNARAGTTHLNIWVFIGKLKIYIELFYLSISFLRYMPFNNLLFCIYREDARDGRIGR